MLCSTLGSGACNILIPLHPLSLGECVDAHVCGRPVTHCCSRVPYRHPQEQRAEPSEESIKRTLDYLHEKAKSATAVTVTESDAVRPMMEVCGLCVCAAREQ